jgi:misacylated tRNA(Ala) deacylase
MYKTNFDAKIIQINEDSSVQLNQTAFYPKGGGQPHDKGILESNDKKYQVTKVIKRGNNILHFLNPSPELHIGDMVKCQIDWDLRYKYSRTHSAFHVLCGVIYNIFGSSVTGVDFADLKGRMDFDIDNFSKDRIKLIEEKCNEAIRASLPVKIEFLPREEALLIPELIRTKVNLIPQTVKTIRTIEIVGLDKQADGGTHVKNTKEIGQIKIVKVDNKGRGLRRIYLEVLDDNKR